MLSIPCAAGLDVHKGHITATVRLCTQTGGEPQCETRTFGALASGLAALVAWLTSHRVAAVPRPAHVEPPSADAGRPAQQVRNQVQKVIDHAGVRIGAVLTDIFGTNGRRILDGLVGRLHQADTLASLSGHVRRKLTQLGNVLGLQLREPERLLLADC